MLVFLQLAKNVHGSRVQTRHEQLQNEADLDATIRSDEREEESDFRCGAHCCETGPEASTSVSGRNCARESPVFAVTVLACV